MNGVEVMFKEGYSIFYINDFSDELKELIRNKLSSICYGEAYASTGRALYSYKNTLKEFIKRYNNKTEDQKKGMIGELLLHVLVTEMLDQFTVNSPYFNMEERNVKKGFDIVLSKTGTTDIWLAESKSGELHSNKDSSQTVVDLLNTAQNDLNLRLNGDSVSLWLEAIHGAQNAIKESREEKSAIVSILQDFGDAATQNSLHSQDFNVLLAGTVYNSLSDKVNEEKVSAKRDRIVGNKYFKDVYVVAIQKGTYQKVYSFLESEIQS